MELVEAVKMAFAAGISWERDYYVIHGVPSPKDEGDRHESTLLSFCLPGQTLEQATRRPVLKALKTAFRHGQAYECEMRGVS